MAVLLGDQEYKSALIVLSGGQDSTTCLFHAIHEAQGGPTSIAPVKRGAKRGAPWEQAPVSSLFYFDEVSAVSFNYGQRHARELDSAAYVYDLARRSRDLQKPSDDHVTPAMPPYRTVKNLGPIFEGNSPLTNAAQALETYTNVSEMDAKLQDRVELTFVPGRNAVFLAIACGIAVARGCTHVITGVNGADNANYPDCEPGFIASIQETMRLATRSEIAILTPLQGMSKADIVRLAQTLPGCMGALAFSTSDYNNQYPPGNNHASVLRAAGFAEAGVADPLIERAKAEGLLQ